MFDSSINQSHMHYSQRESYLLCLDFGSKANQSLYINGVSLSFEKIWEFAMRVCACELCVSDLGD